MLSLTVLISKKPGKLMHFGNTLNIGGVPNADSLITDWVRNRIGLGIKVDPVVYDRTFSFALSGLLMQAKCDPDGIFESHLVGGLVKLTIQPGDLPSMFEKIPLTPESAAGNPIIAEVLIREKGRIAHIHNVKRNREPNKVWCELNKYCLSESERIKVGMVVSDIFSGKVVKNIVSLSDTRDLQVVYPGDQKEDLRKVSIRSGRRELIFGVVDFKSSQQKIDDHLSDIFGRMTKIVDLPPTDELWGSLEIVKQRISKGYLGYASAAVMPIPISVMVTRYVKEEDNVKVPEHIRYNVNVKGVGKDIILSTDTHPDQIRDAISKIYVDVAEEYSGAKQMAVDEALSALPDPTFFINGQYLLWGAERVFLTVECVDVQQWNYKDCDVNLLYPFDLRCSTFRNIGEVEIATPVGCSKETIGAAEYGLRQFNWGFTPVDDVDQIYPYSSQFDECKLHPKLSDKLNAIANSKNTLQGNRNIATKEEATGAETPYLTPAKMKELYPGLVFKDLSGEQTSYDHLRDWLIKRYDVQTEEKPHWDTRPGNVCLGLPTKGIDIYEISQMSVGFYDTLASGRRAGKNTARYIYLSNPDKETIHVNDDFSKYVTHRGEITYKGKTVKVVFTADAYGMVMIKKIDRRIKNHFPGVPVAVAEIVELIQRLQDTEVNGAATGTISGIEIHIYKVI